MPSWTKHIGEVWMPDAPDELQIQLFHHEVCNYAANESD